MGEVVSLASRRPHLVVHTVDGDELSAPLDALVQYINGEVEMSSVAGDRSEELVRLMLADYLSTFGGADV